MIAGEVLGGSVVCGDPLTSATQGNRYDSTCRLVCEDGWKSIGESSAICRGEGKWTARLGVCQSENYTTIEKFNNTTSAGPD